MKHVGRTVNTKLKVFENISQKEKFLLDYVNLPNVVKSVKGLFSGVNLISVLLFFQKSGPNLLDVL